jgi:hypothetical protein
VPELYIFSLLGLFASTLPVGTLVSAFAASARNVAELADESTLFTIVVDAA